MSKCLLYSDWLIALGGGERYLFALADVLAPSCEVTVAAPELPARERMRDLGFSSAYPLRVLSRASLPTETGNYDLFIHVTTRLPMPSCARRSFAVVQFPVDSTGRLSRWRHPKARLRAGPPERALRGYEFVVYSDFAREWLKRRWRVDPRVLRPPLLIPEPPTLEELLSAKERQIISVGRFFGDGSNKRQDALIEAYKLLPLSVQQDWPLLLVGVAAKDPRSKRFVESLRDAADGSNIHFRFDQAPAELERQYRASSVFWSAAGYGRPSHKPELAEHFGMVTVEAMSRAAAPVVFDDGGQAEIVTKAGGVTWSTLEGLVDATRSLVSDKTHLRHQQALAHEAAVSYSYEEFADGARQLFIGDGPAPEPAPARESGGRAARPASGGNPS